MTQATAGRRRPALIIIGVVLLLGALAGAAYGFSYLFLRDPAPAPVGAASAVASAPASAASGEPASSTQPSAAAPAGTGSWSVDASVGSFDDFSSAFVGYRVEEELAGIGAATAVGRTPDVTGTLTLDGTTLSAVEITADLTTLVSDDDRRDGQLRRQALETDSFPTATFLLTEPIELPDGALDGEPVSVTATGDLTLHGVTQSVDIPITATLADGVITVTGSIEIAFADFDIDQPQSFVVLSVADVGVMELQLHFTEA